MRASPDERWIPAKRSGCRGFLCDYPWGQRKSRLLRNLILQDIDEGRGVGFIDPHGDVAEELLDCIPTYVEFLDLPRRRGYWVEEVGGFPTQTKRTAPSFDVRT